MRPWVEEVTLEGNQHARPVKPPTGFQLAPERGRRGVVKRAGSVRGGVAVPMHLREITLHGGDLRPQRGRTDRPGQQAQAVAAIGTQSGEVAEQHAAECLPTAVFVEMAHALRPPGIVHVQNGGLAKHIRSAARPRMLRVALDLDRATVVGRHQDAVGQPVQQRDGGIVGELARLLPLRLRHPRHFLRAGVVAAVVATRQPRQRERGRHQPQELPPLRPGGEMADGAVFLAQEALELRRVGQLLEAAPLLRPGRFAAHRWQIEQSDSRCAPAT